MLKLEDGEIMKELLTVYKKQVSQMKIAKEEWALCLLNLSP